MAAKITVVGDNNVRIVVDEGSSVRNVRVRGKTYSVGREVGWATVFARFMFYLACFLFCIGAWVAVFYAFEKLAFGQSAGSCELVKDADKRHYCRACSGKPGECEFIRSADLRQTCRALCKSKPK